MELPDFVAARPKRTVITAGIASGLIGLFLLVFAMGQTPTSDAGSVKKELNETLTSQQAGLEDDYATLIGDISSADVDRLNRDISSGRDLALSLARTSGSTLALGAQQALLVARFDDIKADSRVVTQFLPEWLSTTAAAGPTPYAMTSFDVQLTRVSGLTYHYTALVRLDPVDAGEKSSKVKPEFILLRYRTTADGSLSSIDASHAASDSREALIGDDDEATTDATPTDTASATTEATTESDDS